MKQFYQKTEKEALLKEIGEVYKAFKNAESYNYKREFVMELDKIFKKLLFKYLAMYFLNSGISGKVINVEDVKDRRFIKLFRFGKIIPEIQAYDCGMAMIKAVIKTAEEIGIKGE